jgi:hypothetical protein
MRVVFVAVAQGESGHRNDARFSSLLDRLSGSFVSRVSKKNGHKKITRTGAWDDLGNSPIDQ